MSDLCGLPGVEKSRNDTQNSGGDGVVCVSTYFSGGITDNFHQNSTDARTPERPGSTATPHLVVEAYVNEVPVLQPRRVQDGAKMAVQLITSNQVAFWCPASATEHRDSLSH